MPGPAGFCGSDSSVWKATATRSFPGQTCCWPIEPADSLSAKQKSLWGWYTWLAGSDKYMTMLRRYVIVHGLRLRFKTFWGDVLICLLLCIAFLILWRAPGIIYYI